MNNINDPIYEEMFQTAIKTQLEGKLQLANEIQTFYKTGEIPTDIKLKMKGGE